MGVKAVWALQSSTLLLCVGTCDYRNLLCCNHVITYNKHITIDHEGQNECSFLHGFGTNSQPKPDIIQVIAHTSTSSIQVAS